MTDQRALNAFEQLLTATLERQVAGAWDPKPAKDIAAEAMRPHGVGSGLRRSARARRYLLLGIAAALLVPAAYFGAETLRRLDENNQLPLNPTLAPVPGPTAEATVPPDGYELILVRRTDTPAPGLNVMSIRPDGAERVVRFVPDSLAPNGRPWDEWAQLSREGWLALAQGGVGPPWPLVLLDLADADSEPWVIEGTNIGGIGPRFGPDGLVAATATSTDPSTINQSVLVIVDLAARRQSTMRLVGGLIGGGPSIVWTEDGGILQSANRPGNLVGYPNGEESIQESVRLFEPDSARDDMRLSDVSDGRQLLLSRLEGNASRDLALIDRASDWEFVDVRHVAPDGSSVALYVAIGSVPEPAAVLVPTGGTGTPSFHSGFPLDYLETSRLDAVATSEYAPPLATGPPPGGEAYRLPTLDVLIAEEIELNPGRVVVGQASHDAVAGDATVEEFDLAPDKPGTFEIYVHCFGPSPVSAEASGPATVNPCTSPGAYGASVTVGRGEHVTITAARDTSWRVILYEGF